MDIINAIILGIIQGLTEFLPVSSSGHLEIAKSIMGGDKLASESMLMTVVLHAATAFSTIIVFRKDIIKIFQGLLEFENNNSFKFSLKIVISMIPAVLIGLLFNDHLTKLFEGSLILVGFCLIITGILLLLTDYKHDLPKPLTLKNALFIGLSQAFAILPGISRSGATISFSVLLGINKETAAKFSFLMVVPLILGKMGQDLLSGNITNNEENYCSLIIGFLAAFITGILACKWMIKLVKNSKLKYFSYYCFLIGVISIILSL